MSLGVLIWYDIRNVRNCNASFLYVSRKCSELLHHNMLIVILVTLFGEYKERVASKSTVSAARCGVAWR